MHSKLHVFDDVSMSCHIEASTTTSVALRDVVEGELIPHSNLRRVEALVKRRLDLGLSSCSPRAYLSTLKAGKVGLLTSSYLGHCRVPFLGCNLQVDRTESQPSCSLLRQGSASPANSTMASHREDRVDSLPGPWHHDEKLPSTFSTLRLPTELWLSANATGGVPMLAFGAVSMAAMLSDRIMESAKVSLVAA